MRKNSTKNELPGAQDGWQAIEEAARLLRQMQFSQHHGAYAEGQYVAVSVDPRWNADHETFRILITCYSFVHCRTDWEKLPIHILPEGRGTGVHAITRLNARGQTLVPRLPPGEYRLSLWSKPARADPVLFQPLERLAAREEGELDERRVWQGEDGTIHWTLEETEEGDVQVALETQDDSLAGCIIAFSLVELDSKRVHYSRQLQLEPTKTPGKWEGWCSIGSRTEFPGPYELQLEILLAKETE